MSLQTWRNAVTPLEFKLKNDIVVLCYQNADSPNDKNTYMQKINTWYRLWSSHMIHKLILGLIPCVFSNDVRENLWPPMVVTSKRMARVCIWNSTLFKGEGWCNYFTTTAYIFYNQDNSDKTGLLLLF